MKQHDSMYLDAIMAFLNKLEKYVLAETSLRWIYNWLKNNIHTIVITLCLAKLKDRLSGRLNVWYAMFTSIMWVMKSRIYFKTL